MPKKILCYGELVVDCFGSIQAGFVPKFGGAPGNTAVGLGKLGHKHVQFAGKVGEDFFADFLRGTLTVNGVDARYLVKAPGERTTLAFVALSKNGQRDFSFFSGAHDHVTVGEVKKIDLKSTAILQFGSLTQSTPESKAATQYLLRAAKKAKVLRSYDPNVRLALWPKPQVLKQVILRTLPQADMLKVNEEELYFLTGQKKPLAGARRLWKKGMQLVLVTLGAKGAFWMTKTGHGFVPVPKVKAIDTTGAGDAFNAGLLYQIEPHVQKGRIQLSDQQIADKVRFATGIAALSTLKKGAVEGFPSLKQAKAFLGR